MSFEQLTALMQEYRARAAPDGYSQLVATGLAYVDYALAHRARFQLMFRSDRLEQGNERLVAAGDRAYAHLRDNHGAGGDQAQVRQRLAGTEDRARLVDGARVHDADAGRPGVCHPGRRRCPARARPDGRAAHAQSAGVRSGRRGRGADGEGAAAVVRAALGCAVAMLGAIAPGPTATGSSELTRALQRPQSLLSRSGPGVHQGARERCPGELVSKRSRVAISAGRFS